MLPMLMIVAGLLNFKFSLFEEYKLFHLTSIMAIINGKAGWIGLLIL